MLKDFFKHYVYPIATLSGSIIGVGFLALPYVTFKVGILPMLFYFAALTALLVILHVIFGKIALKTPDFKRWPGFVGFYLGKWPKAIILISTTLGSFGVLLLYLIVGGQFLGAILNPFFGGGTLQYMLLNFIVVSTFVYFGIKLISRVDLYALLALCAILLVIFIRGFAWIKFENIFFTSTLAAGDFKTMFLPYGAIMFALWGTGLIPEVEEMLRGSKKSLKKVIIIGTLIPAVIYLVFIFLILGITGPQTTDSALLGLKNVLGNGVVSIALLIGVITSSIAFIAQGLLLKKVFMYDLGVKHLPAWIFVCFIPLILFLLGVNSFIDLISFVGGVLLGIDGILILLMYRKIGGRAVVIYPLMLVFVIGIIYSVIYFL
ncbi:MAG: aromatic amino acid transport family protein [bacterium]|nr:aromatic amino acid transport family protein [bacterium]